jgi:glutamate 5-kinase
MDDVLPRLLEGEAVGTLFAPQAKKRTSRSRWIGSVQPAGGVIVDAGAVAALVEKNKSLLPAGVVKVEGHFSRGDVIAITGPEGRVIGRGLSNYDAGDVMRIRGKKTREVRELLAEAAYDEVIHRDNLVLC